MNHPFDEFSKSLSEPVPRRVLLRRLGAVVTGALLGPLALGLGNASANPDNRPRRRRHLGLRRPAPKQNPKRDPCQDFCRCSTSKKQSQCLAACRACNNDPSRLCGTCGSYTCSNLSSDPNCGACGNNCGAKGRKCCGGRCGGRCADLKNDKSLCQNLLSIVNRQAS